MSRWDWSQVLTPALYIVMVGILAVFAHTGLSGEHGLSALHQAEAREVALEHELQALQAEREALANRVERLDERNLDLDLLDERARRVLGRTRPDEVVIR